MFDTVIKPTQIKRHERTIKFSKRLQSVAYYGSLRKLSLKLVPREGCDRTIILLGPFSVMIGPGCATSHRRERLIARYKNFGHFITPTAQGYETSLIRSRAAVVGLRSDSPTDTPFRIPFHRAERTCPDSERTL